MQVCMYFLPKFIYLQGDTVNCAFYRGKLNLNGNMELVHPIVEPISLRLDMKRALPPHRTDLHYDIFGKLHIVKVSHQYYNTVKNNHSHW